MRRAVLLGMVAALVVPAATAAQPTRYHGAQRKPHRAAAKHVRRDERVRTIPPQGRPVVAPKPPGTPTPPPPKPLARLQVVAREWSVTPSRLTLAAGRVAVELDNFGQDPHDLRVERASDPASGFNFTLAKPRTRSTQTLDLGPGTWKLYCTLPGHEALGMRALVTVAG